MMVLVQSALIEEGGVKKVLDEEGFSLLSAFDLNCFGQ